MAEPTLPPPQTVDIAQFLVDVDAISAGISTNPLYTKALDSLTESLDNIEVSTEEKDKLISSFLQNFSVPALTMAFEYAGKLPALVAGNNEAKYKELAVLAQIRKQWGYGNVTLNGLGEDTKDGVTDEQIRGFRRDSATKMGRMITELSGMQAQNDIPTPRWLYDVLRLSIEIMTDGRADIVVADDAEGNPVTTVTWDKDATEPDGLNE